METRRFTASVLVKFFAMHFTIDQTHVKHVKKVAKISVTYSVPVFMSSSTPVVNKKKYRVTLFLLFN